MRMLLHFNWYKGYQACVQREQRMSLPYSGLLHCHERRITWTWTSNRVWWSYLQNCFGILFSWIEEAYYSLRCRPPLSLSQVGRIRSFWFCLCRRTIVLYLLCQALSWNWSLEAGTWIFCDHSLSILGSGGLAVVAWRTSIYVLCSSP